MTLSYFTTTIEATIFHFEAVSGFLVNFFTSELIGVVVELEHLLEVANLMGCIPASQLPISDLLCAWEDIKSPLEANCQRIKKRLAA